ncbi:hypothetical protein BG015_011814 [Linnemannia schmuckeri]|uniref:DUF7137 domain-containing protein n=1 Tax=Linnemannia schmuckeri TaxID=64567 RepID=A0A9P5RS30_9FUNG|nr:hypothetical protein BG015_011814 [Linnemannia schmuckeri]
MTRSDPSHITRSTTKTLTRALLMALLGLLCLSNVFVQGQGTNTSPPSASTTTGGASTTTGGTPGTQTGTPTGTASVTGTGTASGSLPAATPTQSRSPMDPRASLTMLQPKVNLKDPPLFPLGVDIQFAWDYDKYLKLQPANLTIEAYSPDNSIITIADAIPGNLKNYTWTAAKQVNLTNPIKTNMYTLRIFDGNVGRFGVLPEGGYLSTFVGLKFGLYIPSTYIPGSQMNPPVSGTAQFAPVTNRAMKTIIPVATLAIVFMVSVLLL